MIFGKKIGFD